MKLSQAEFEIVDGRKHLLKCDCSRGYGKRNRWDKDEVLENKGRVRIKFPNFKSTCPKCLLYRWYTVKP